MIVVSIALLLLIPTQQGLWTLRVVGLETLSFCIMSILL